MSTTDSTGTPIDQAGVGTPLVVTGDAAAPSAGALAAEPTAPVIPLAERPEITRDEVLSVNDSRIIIVPVDEWKKGAVVFVHTPTATDADMIEYQIVTGGEKLPRDAVRAAYVIACVRNADGSRKFKAEDLEALKRKSMGPMNRIWNAIAESSIITEQDVEDLAKNSGAATAAIS